MLFLFVCLGLLHVCAGVCVLRVSRCVCTGACDTDWVRVSVCWQLKWGWDVGGGTSLAAPAQVFVHSCPQSVSGKHLSREDRETSTEDAVRLHPQVCSLHGSPSEGSIWDWTGFSALLTQLSVQQPAQSLVLFFPFHSGSVPLLLPLLSPAELLIQFIRVFPLLQTCELWPACKQFNV